MMDDDNRVILTKLDTLSEKVDRLSGRVEDQYGSSTLQYGDNTDRIVLRTDQEDENDNGSDGDENKERGNWSNHFDFILACLGYAVGLGNVWRFPYLCYRNGGAIFFIPYIIMLAIVGMPIFFMELSLGQFTSASPLTCWEMAPIFKGIGAGMLIVSGLVAIYYNVIIAWSFFYLFASFTSDLPWRECDPYWASEFCSTFLEDSSNCTEMGYNASTNGVCYNGTQVYGIWNETMAGENGIKSVIPSQEYLERYVWGKNNSAGIHDVGPIRWQLALCLLLSWVIVFAALAKGIKSSGKVVYFTALFPYVVLVILLIRGVTLEGYYEGILYYIARVDYSKLSEAGVWKDAAVQIFFSLSASWGGLIALSSYNRFHNDCLRDSLIVSIGNCLTSFFAGFVIFSFLGFLANAQGTSVENVVDSGVGLAFIVYPAAVTRMPVSPLWAILFFVMLITLGLDSEFALVETVTTCIFDQWPKTRKRKWLVILIMSILMFLPGLAMCTNGGSSVLTIMDDYAGGWNVLVIAFLECICISYIYGYQYYRNDIRLMIGQPGTNCGNCWTVAWTPCSYWWALCWHILTPITVVTIIIFSLVDYSPSKDNGVPMPDWANGIGWFLTFLVLGGILFTSIGKGIYNYMHGEPLLYRSRFWGPSLPEHRAEVNKANYGVHLELRPWDDPTFTDEHMDPIHYMESAEKTGTENPNFIRRNYDDDDDDDDEKNN